MSSHAQEPDDLDPGGPDPWRGIAELSPVSMSIVGVDGSLSVPNQAFATMIGYTCAELRGMRFHDITHPDDFAMDQDLFDQALRGERTSYRVAKRFLHADGRVVWGDLSVALIRSDSGAPQYFIGQVLDVTTDRQDRERLAEALREVGRERARSDVILDTVDVGLVLLDGDGRFERVNRQQEAVLELSHPGGHLGVAGQRGHVYGADGTTPLTSEELPCARAARGEEFDDQRVWVGAQPEHRRALAVSARTVRDERGQPDGAALSFSDVTDLLEALQVREVFVASVSHELRTPLTVVLGHLEMLLDQEELPEPVARQLTVVARSAVRLRTLVSDLLDPATSDSGGRPRGQIVLECVPTDLAGLVVEVVESVLPEAKAAHVVLAVVTLGPSRVVLDPQRVRQAVENLVGNAVKYTDAGGRVDVRLRVHDGTAVLSVEDTGIGIEPGDMTRLFTPFFRADPARRRVAPGLGLGLGIARSIVLAHGGSLEVRSESGRGSTFIAMLPTGGPGGTGPPPP